MPGVLIATGAVLCALAFLLAFTIYGEAAAVAGVALVIVGSTRTGRRKAQRVWSPPGEK